jgi:hypothetical protein
MKNAGWIYFDWFLGCSFSAVPPFFFPSLLCNLPFWFFSLCLSLCSALVLPFFFFLPSSQPLGSALFSFSRAWPFSSFYRARECHAVTSK